MKVMLFILIFVFPDRPIEVEYSIVKECPSISKVKEYVAKHGYSDDIIAFQPACHRLDLGNPL